MIDLYQMASLAGISGSWLTGGEMLWQRPLSSLSTKGEGLGMGAELLDGGQIVRLRQRLKVMGWARMGA